MSIATEIRNESYIAIKPKMNRQERAVWEYLDQHGKATAWEIADALGMLVTSARRALFDLRGKRWAQESGKAFCGKTGVNVTVWMALPMLPLAPVEIKFEGNQAVFA